MEYGRQGLRANAVCPGSIKTPMTGALKMPDDIDGALVQRILPLDKPRGPETVAGVIAMLASGMAHTSTVSTSAWTAARWPEAARAVTLAKRPRRIGDAAGDALAFLSPVPGVH